jgi:hypothetical protein
MTKNNVDIVEEIKKTIDARPGTRMDMSHGLINIRALARYIIKEQKINVPIDAVISAIRRYDLDPPMPQVFENARKVVKQASTMSTRNPIGSINVVKDSEIQQLLSQLFSIIHYQQGHIKNHPCR